MPEEKSRENISQVTENTFIFIQKIFPFIQVIFATEITDSHFDCGALKA